MVTLLHEMRRRAADAPRPFYGLATLCVGVGQGEATIVEWIGD
jgi:acetyl-CoA acetyltransferase